MSIPFILFLYYRFYLNFYSAEKVLEARNTTVAPPGRRSARLTSSAADGDTSLQPAAEPNTRGKDQVDRLNDSDHGSMMRKCQDDDDGYPGITECERQVNARNNDDSDTGKTRKHQVSAQGDDDGDHGITTRKRQVNAQDNDDDNDGITTQQRGTRKRQDDDGNESPSNIQDTTPFHGRQRERPTPLAGHRSRTPSIQGKNIFFYVSQLLVDRHINIYVRCHDA